MTRRSATRRLAFGEYGPLLGWVAAWAIVIVSVGHADAVRLLAAVSFVRSARYLTAPASWPLVRSRLIAPGKVHPPSGRTVLLVELCAVAGAAAMLALLLGALLAARQEKTAILCLIIAAGLPARVLYPLAAVRKIQPAYRLVVALTGLVLVGGVWLAGGSLFEFAAAFAVREWVALAIAFLVARRRKPVEEPFEPLRWRQVASQSHHTARRRFTYRVSKILLKFALGPLGSVAARTGRGLRADRKLAPYVPQSRWALAAVFLGLTGAGVALILAVPKPAMLFLAAALTRVGASAGNIVLWSMLAQGEQAFVDDDDDDD